MTGTAGRSGYLPVSEHGLIGSISPIPTCWSPVSSRRAEAIAVFFKTAREADRLIEGLQDQGVPYVFGVPGAKIINYRRPRRLRHTTDIATQLHEDVLLRASVQIPSPSGTC